MERYYSVLIVIITGIITLFFFPEPATNFLAYFGTMLFFALLTISSILWTIKKRK